jgi:hypothetical protein
MPERRCTECGKPLGKEARAGKVTCDQRCRQKRARRIRREREKAARERFDTPVAQVRAIVKGETKDATHEVMKEELRPIVREAMTADVLAKIGDLVGITGEAIETLKKQLESEDETIAQRAATTILRYTMGNPSVAPAPAEQQPSPMTVVFNVPRPGDSTSGSADTEGDADEVRTCSECGETKTVQEFVANSTRCQSCHQSIEEHVRARFG